MFPKSFDSYIDPSIVISGNIQLGAGTKMVIEGSLIGFSTVVVAETSETVNIKKLMQTEITLNGKVTGNDVSSVKIPKITINGDVQVAEIYAENVLTIKAKAVLKAEKIYYRSLIIEPGAVILGALLHLDHVSEGEVL